MSDDCTTKYVVVQGISDNAFIGPDCVHSVHDSLPSARLEGNALGGYKLAEEMQMGELMPPALIYEAPYFPREGGR